MQYDIILNYGFFLIIKKIFFLAINKFARLVLLLLHLYTLYPLINYFSELGAKMFFKIRKIYKNGKFSKNVIHYDIKMYYKKMSLNDKIP